MFSVDSENGAFCTKTGNVWTFCWTIQRFFEILNSKQPKESKFWKAGEIMLEIKKTCFLQETLKRGLMIVLRITYWCLHEWLRTLSHFSLVVNYLTLFCSVSYVWKESSANTGMLSFSESYSTLQCAFQKYKMPSCLSDPSREILMLLSFQTSYGTVFRCMFLKLHAAFLRSS